MAKKKKKRVKKGGVKSDRMDTFMPFPQRDIGDWVGDWMLSGLALKAWSKNGSFPKYFRFLGIKDRKDGGADIQFELGYDG